MDVRIRHAPLVYRHRICWQRRLLRHLGTNRRSQSKGYQMKPYVALYSRVSSKNGRQSTDSQKLALKRYSRERGLKHCQYFEDFATGRNCKRDNLQQIIDDCRQGKCNHLVIWKMDRLSRNCRDTLNLISEMLALKVRISVISQSIEFDNSPMSNFMIQVLSSISELESGFISERVKAGLAVARSKGIRLGRKPETRKRAQLQKWLDAKVPVAIIAQRLNKSRQSVYGMIERMKGNEATNDE